MVAEQQNPSKLTMDAERGLFTMNVPGTEEERGNGICKKRNGLSS